MYGIASTKTGLKVVHIMNLLWAQQAERCVEERKGWENTLRDFAWTILPPDTLMVGNPFTSFQSPPQGTLLTSNQPLPPLYVNFFTIYHMVLLSCWGIGCHCRTLQNVSSLKAGPLFPKHLQQCLVRGKHSGSICWEEYIFQMRKWRLNDSPGKFAG